MRALYTNGKPSATTTATRSVRGYLGHGRSDWERSDLAAKTYVQQLPIEAPTLEQVAFAYRVSAASVRRRLNGSGKPGNGRNAETLAEHLIRSAPSERLEAARALGVDKMWDEMVAPLVAGGGR